MTLEPDRPPATQQDLVASLTPLLRFGSQLMRAGDTAFRVRRLMGTAARAIGLDSLALQLGLRNISVTGHRDGQTATLVCEVGSPGVDNRRISALEDLARSTRPGTTAGEFAQRLAVIEAATPRYTVARIGVAVGAACGAFTMLSGGTAFEVLASAIAGGLGQCLRSLLLQRRFNQYAIAAVCAVAASGAYCLIAMAVFHDGSGAARHPVGLISSVLFLVPGFPLIAALLDLLQHETATAADRLAYAMTLLLTAALGLGVVIALVGFSVQPPTPLANAGLATFVLRALASFVGGGGFAVLYGSSRRNVLQIALLSVIGNEVRLWLYDGGFALPAATFLGSFAVGLMASLVRRWAGEARIALTVPGIIMMVPGRYAFETLVQFSQSEILPALKTAVLVGFVVGAMAAGLATARFITQPAWLKE